MLIFYIKISKVLLFLLKINYNMEQFLYQIPLSNKIDLITQKKMNFIYNALEKGWSIKKNKNKYIFTKPTLEETEVYLDDYLKNIIDEFIS